MRHVWARGRVLSSSGRPGKLPVSFAWELSTWTLSRCKTGRVIFEIGGGGIREELAREGAPFRLYDFQGIDRL